MRRWRAALTVFSSLARASNHARTWLLPGFGGFPSPTSKSVCAMNFLSSSALIGCLSSRSRNSDKTNARSPPIPLSSGTRGVGKFVRAQ